MISSQFFRDMPDYDEKICGTTPKEIDFDVEAKILALLLDLLDGRVIQTSLMWSDLGEVLEVGAKYRFFHLGPLILSHIATRTLNGDPWKTFVIASNLDLPLIAKRALADFERTYHLWGKTFDEIAPSEMSGVAGPYVAALLRGIRLHASREVKCRKHPSKGSWIDYYPIDWSAVSHAFRLE
jgi:hypothetical protein